MYSRAQVKVESNKVNIQLLSDICRENRSMGTGGIAEVLQLSGATRALAQTQVAKFFRLYGLKPNTHISLPRFLEQYNTFLTVLVVNELLAKPMGLRITKPQLSAVLVESLDKDTVSRP